MKAEHLRHLPVAAPVLTNVAVLVHHSAKNARRWLALLLSAILTAASVGQARTGPGYHGSMPAGYTVVRLLPSGANVSFLGLIECSEMEGARQVSEGLSAKVLDSHGAPMRSFPRKVSFRVTATLRKTLIDPPLDSVATDETPAEFLIKLVFRLRVYHGLERQVLAPESVQMIGVPADVAYDERVFRVTFDLNKIPVTDRLVLEVVSPEDDEPITHFSFGLL